MKPPSISVCAIRSRAVEVIFSLLHSIYFFSALTYLAFLRRNRSQPRTARCVKSSYWGKDMARDHFSVGVHVTTCLGAVDRGRRILAAPLPTRFAFGFASGKRCARQHLCEEGFDLRRETVRAKGLPVRCSHGLGSIGVDAGIFMSTSGGFFKVKYSEPQETGQTTSARCFPHRPYIRGRSSMAVC